MLLAANQTPDRRRETPGFAKTTRFSQARQHVGSAASPAGKPVGVD